MISEVPTVAPETVLNDLFDSMNGKVPLAVVDGERRLRGILIKGAVLAALSGNSIPEAGDNRAHT